MVITFEGPDMSGKSTQAKLLYDRLNNKYKNKAKLLYLHFPNYDSPIGGLIGEILKGKKEYPGDAIMQTLYVLDQAALYDEIKKTHTDGGIVVIDRYDLSTLAYLKDDSSFALELIKKTQELLYPPNITIFFDTEGKPFDRDGELDIFEKDKEYMNQINSKFLTLANNLIRETKVFKSNTEKNSLSDKIFNYIVENIDFIK